jgi:GH24 family phage-related lysozyme (muramidase)
VPDKIGTPTPPDPSMRRRGAIAIAVVAMCGVTSAWEGERLVPYRDRLGTGHPMTVCRGDTNVPMHVYTHQQCSVILEGEARDVYLPAVRRRLPTIEQDPYIWAAFGDFAYNAGIGRFNKSSVARLYEHGHKADACRAMAQYKFSNHRVVPGLYLRRIGDKYRIGDVELCLTPFPR